MALYTVDAGVAAGTDLPIINCTGSASIRLRLVEWIMGSSTAPADVATSLRLVRTTDAGTGGTALTVAKVDPLTVAATGTAKSGTYTTAPTKSDVLQRIALNQRATHKWTAYDEDHAFVASAAANNGIMMNSTSSGGTPTIDLTMKWKE